MNDARPSLIGVTASSLKEDAAGKEAAKKAIRIEIKLDTGTKNSKNYEFSYPDLLKHTIKNLKMEGENFGRNSRGCCCCYFRCKLLNVFTEFASLLVQLPKPPKRRLMLPLDPTF